MSKIWDELVEEMTPFIGKVYLREGGRGFIFSGLVDELDADYYYLMWDTEMRQYELFSCVGTLEGCGFNLACTY